MKKTVLTSLLAIALLIVFVPFRAEASDDLRLWVDGRFVEADSDPYIEDSRTLVPIRFIAEALGYKVDWENATRTVIIDDGVNVITMQIENNTASFNGKQIQLNKGPAIRNGRTYIPVRDVAETLGKYVDWDNDNFTVVIGKGYQGPIQGVRASITEEDAKEIALNFADGRIESFEADDDKYEIDIIKDGYKYKFEISKLYGDIMDIEVEYSEDDIMANGRTLMGRDMAEKRAQEIAPGRVVKFEFDDGKYEIEIISNGFRYDIEINAYDGNIIEYEREDEGVDDEADDEDNNTSRGQIISADEAREIALKEVDGNIVEFELDDDDMIYEIKVIADGKEHDIEIDASSGEVLKHEIDDIDEDDGDEDEENELDEDDGYDD